MKKTLLIAYIVLLHMAIAALFFKPEISPKVQEKLGLIETSNLQFSRMLNYHRAMDSSIEPGSSIFLGDSITQGLATSSVTDRSVNFGIGQQNTKEMLIAVAQYKSLKNASKIYILIGVNDIAQGKTDGIGERYAEIAKYLPIDVPVVWSAVMPTLDPKIDLDKVKAVNSKAKQACDSLPKCRFIDTTTPFLDTSGNVDPSNFVDGLHLSTQGYKRWIVEMKKASQ